MDNRVFFQHPDLMRQLCVHETVMQLMVNTLNKAQLQQQASAGAGPQDLNASQNQQAPHSSTDALIESSKVCGNFVIFIIIFLNTGTTKLNKIEN